jgi:hypothetical protein
VTAIFDDPIRGEDTRNGMPILVVAIVDGCFLVCGTEGETYLLPFVHARLDWRHDIKQNAWFDNPGMVSTPE